MRLLARIAGLVLSALLLGTAGAIAATVSVRGEQGAKGPPRFYAHYFAPPGERNVVTVSRGDYGVEFADTGAEIEVADDCVRLDGHTARCPRGDAETFLGDLDDRGRAGTGRLYGGPGNDVLDGSALSGTTATTSSAASPGTTG